MPIPVIMPKFNNLQEESLIAEWIAKEGDELREGDPLCEVETDKVNMEVEAPEDGVLAGVRFGNGDTVPVTEIIAYLLLPGETVADIPEVKAETETAVSSPPSNDPAPKITPVAKRVAEANAVDVQNVQGSGPHGRILRRDVELQSQPAPSNGKVRATPAARHLAREKDVLLAEIVGSGPNGRIHKADVASQLKPVPLTQPTDDVQIVELSKMRRTIAQRMQTSVQTAPHIFVETQVDTGKLDDLRALLKARGERLTVTAVLAKACAVTLKKHPHLNATFEDENFYLWPTVNMGIVVSLENGLVVPVIAQVETQSLQQIQTTVDDVSQRARDNKLREQDLGQGTFTISNLGMLGVTRFTAIINQPQVAILAVGTAVNQFLPDANNQPQLCSLMTLTLSVDHRVVDGADAARFLADLKAVLEEPALLAW